MNNEYIMHTAIKCSDGKIYRLSYDLTKQTEGSVREFGRVFKEIENRFPDVLFWIDQYPDKSTDDFIRIYGNEIKDSLKIEGAIHQMSDITSPSILGMDY